MSENDHDRLIRLEGVIDAMQRALVLQAHEYERRLTALNHAHEQAQELAATTVTKVKFDDYVRSERESRAKALERIDERFEEFVRRYEARHEEITKTLNAREGAIKQAKDASERMEHRMNLTVAALGLVMTVVILLANHIL